MHKPIFVQGQPMLIFCYIYHFFRWIDEKVLIGNTNHPFHLLIEITFTDIRDYNVNQLPSFALRKITFNNCNQGKLSY